MKRICENCGWGFEDFEKTTPCQVCGSSELHEATKEEEEIALNGRNNWRHCADRAIDKIESRMDRHESIGE